METKALSPSGQLKFSLNTGTLCISFPLTDIETLLEVEREIKTLRWLGGGGGGGALNCLKISAM